jgi:hypothetical protein
MDSEVEVGPPKHTTTQGEFVFADNVRDAIGMFNLMIPWQSSGDQEDLMTEAAALGQAAQDRFRGRTTRAVELSGSSGELGFVMDAETKSEGEGGVSGVGGAATPVSEGAATPVSEPTTPRSQT